MRGYHALLLAAGAGSRFGGGKLLSSWQGEALVRASARIALAAPVDLCVVVTGCDAQLIEATLEELEGPRLRVVRATEWQLGLSASVRRGIEALPADSRGVVVFLADMPLVPPGHAKRLIEALESGAVAAEMVFKGHPAHPVAFQRALYADLLVLNGDKGGRGLLRGLPAVARLPTSDLGSAFDVDWPDEIEGIR